MANRKMIASLCKTRFDNVFFEFGTDGLLFYSVYKNREFIATVIIEEN
jgi:hypothetical protein